MRPWVNRSRAADVRHIAFTCVLTVVMALDASHQPAGGQDMVLRGGGDTVRIGAGRIAASDSLPARFSLRRMAGANVAAMTVRARMLPTRTQLLGLSVFALRDSVPGESPLCQAEGFGPVVQCRAVFADTRTSSYLVMVSHGGGKGSIDYALEAVPVSGPLLYGTALSLSDARNLELNRLVADSIGVVGTDRSNAALYQVNLSTVPRESVYVSLAPDDRRSLKLRLFDAHGRSLDEFEPTAAYAQRRVWPAGSPTVFLLVQPTDDRDYGELTRYAVRVGASPSAVQALAPDGETAWSGTGAQQFDLRVPAGWSGIIALGGRGQVLSVRDSVGTAWPVESAFGGTTLGARVGEPWLNSPFVRHGLTRSTRLTIDVSPDSGQRYHSDWNLTV
ncbi:MAG: hypothetical protein JWM41_1120, partial [Gemmatimonadetes bacterium]|nr:hypothetical protein [Gemmatimonadota bacterium]